MVEYNEQHNKDEVVDPDRLVKNVRKKRKLRKAEKNKVSLEISFVFV